MFITQAQLDRRSEETQRAGQPWLTGGHPQSHPEAGRQATFPKNFFNWNKYPLGLAQPHLKTLEYEKFKKENNSLKTDAGVKD